MIRFREAVESGNYETFPSLMAEEITLLTPVLPMSFSGRGQAAAVLQNAFRVFEDFRYERELASEDGRDLALPFQAAVGAVPAQGCDFLHLDEEGLIDRFTVMLRPLPAVQAMADAMAAMRAQ